VANRGPVGPWSSFKWAEKNFSFCLTNKEFNNIGHVAPNAFKPSIVEIP